jgi:hypothetical protein
LLPVVFRADVFDSLVNHVLELIGGNVSECCAGFPDRLVKDPPADGFLSMNFERSPFFMPWAPKKERRA